VLATKDATARLHRLLEGLYCYADVRTDEPQTQLAKALAAEVVQRESKEHVSACPTQAQDRH